jgi:NAD(P)H dehydrogenase (quinone)
MKIGVSGASGHLGRAVVSELRRRAGGHEIVAVSRTPETVSGPAEGRFGDYDRPESLVNAYAGLGLDHPAHELLRRSFRATGSGGDAPGAC